MSRNTDPDLFALRFLRSAQLSPDGRNYAYAVSYTDDREHYEVWIGGIRTNRQQRLAYAGDARWPRWSPDGRRLAFIADGRLRLADYPALEISEALTPGHLLVQGPLSWSPDSARIVMSIRSQRNDTIQGRIVSRLFRADGIGYLGGVEQHIYEFDLSRRALRVLASPQPFCSQPEWSPCGRRVLFLANDHPIPFASTPPGLLTVAVDGGQISRVLGDGWYVEHARWIEGGNRIAFTGARDSTLTIPVPELWTVDAHGGGEQLRTQGIVGQVGSRTHHDMPARELMAANPICVLDRRTAYVSLQRGGVVEIWSVALEGEVSMRKVAGGERTCIVLDVNKRGDEILFAATNVQSPPELRHSSLDGSNEAALTALNAQELASWPHLAVERFEFSSTDGMRIEAWFLARRDRGRPVPSVLFIHPGPFIAAGHSFRYDFHLLAGRGYGVVFANFRGSAGYGEAFTRAIMGNWGARAYPDHIGAIDAAIALGFVDADRIGVWGPSHGGFATCWIVGQTGRFRAAVAEASFSDLATMYYSTDAPEVWVRDLGGRPDEVPDLYRAGSPMTYAHRCSTPTLLLHGEEDYRCPISEAERFHRALHDTGCATELVRIPGCSHLGDSNGPLCARRAQNEALVEWFERHL